MKRFFFVVALMVTTGSLLAQDIQVNRQNKTISVTADESVTADAEIAVLAIGYHNYGPTQDAAFQENVRAAERITNTLLDAKVPRVNIETEKLQLTRAEIEKMDCRNEKGTSVHSRTVLARDRTRL
ncbi:MAG: SIMPL domain-containing protein [Terriglobales bacterium]